MTVNKRKRIFLHFQVKTFIQVDHTCDLVVKITTMRNKMNSSQLHCEERSASIRVVLEDPNHSNRLIATNLRHLSINLIELKSI